MSKIKMLKSVPGALNGGLNVKLFQKDLIYDREEMEGIDEIFLENKFAEAYVEPEEVVRHQKGLTGAPENKRIEVEEVKEAEEKPKSKRGYSRKK